MYRRVGSGEGCRTETRALDCFIAGIGLTHMSSFSALHCIVFGSSCSVIASRLSGIVLEAGREQSCID